MTEHDAPGSSASPGPRLRTSANVRAEVARANADVVELRSAIEMSRATWRRRMQNPGEWRIGELRKIADYLGVPIHRLANGDEK